MEYFISICIIWLTDGVFAIREAACKLMKILFDLFKSNEFEKKLLEKLNEMKSNSSYLIRNTVLFMIKYLIHSDINLDLLEKKLFPLIVKLAKYKISNVRMNAAFIIKKIYKILNSKELIKEIQMIIEDLRKDSDIDVINALNDLLN